MITLITNRTEADVLLRNERGTYGASDLNRVETAVQEINGQFGQLGISMTLETKTDWMNHDGFSKEQDPTVNQMERYLNNVKIIRDLFKITCDLPQTMEKLTYDGANNIEKVLSEAIARLKARNTSIFYSGEIFSGEEY